MRNKDDAFYLARFLAVQSLLGCAVALFFAAALLTTDTAGLRTLIAISPSPVISLICFLLGSLTAIIPFFIATAFERHSKKRR